MIVPETHIFHCAGEPGLLCPSSHFVIDRLMCVRQNRDRDGAQPKWLRPDPTRFETLGRVLINLPPG